MASIDGAGGLEFRRLQQMARLHGPTTIGQNPPQTGVERPLGEVEESGRSDDSEMARQEAISASLMQPVDSVSMSAPAESDQVVAPTGQAAPTGELSSKDLMAQFRATGLNTQARASSDWG